MELTPQQWENVKELFEIALEKTPAERSSFLATATQDAAVRAEVERLLAHQVESGGFLSRPAVAGASTSPSSHTQSFSAGDVVADRFRIIRFLARGGMGEVYEAEDLELHERVALKSIRSELLHDARALDRFKREVQLARKVTHPNVCRIFDLFRHSQTAATGASSSSVAFVAMELLEGENLADFLHRQPRIGVEQTQPIALQMASGLGAAHAAGVLHRDFKPGNVLLVSGAKGFRAVITDFGLALHSDQDLSLASVTGTGEVIGTPAFMSPEQVEGKELTPASDVYSLGLVLYQMLTGTRAFESTTPLSMAVRRIKEDPVPPRTIVPDLDQRWESVVLKCLERDPKNRFQTGDEVAEALRDNSQHAAKWNRESRRKLAALAVAALFVVAGLVGISRIYRRPPSGGETAPTIQPAIPARPSVAVLPFHNLSGKTATDWVATALPEMLTAELAVGSKLRTFPGENIARASADLGLTGKQTLASDTLRHLRDYLGSDYVVLGSYLDQGSVADAQVRVDLWLQNTKTGEIAATISEKGNENALDELATRAGADLRRQLGVGPVTSDEAAVLRASLPSNPEAVRLYSEGLAKLRVVDAVTARDLLQRAVASDPRYALAHSALADAWQAMGYDEKAREQSKKALDLSSGLSREERLWIEGRDWELNRKWDKAVEIYRTLFQFFPDNIEYGLRLASAQRQARTADEALATLATLRRLRAPDNADPRIDLQTADVFDVKGAYKEEQAAAEAAAKRARDLGANLLLARALNQQARCFEKQGKLDQALNSSEEARRISESAGERAEVAKALTITGIVRFDQGNFAEAASAYQRALAIEREIGDKRATATTLNDLANALGEQGKVSDSIKMLSEALSMFREVGDKHSAAAVLGSMAARTVETGDLKQGKRMLEEGLAASRELGDRERASTALYNLGEVLRWQGDLIGARKMYEDSEQLSKQIGDQSGVAYGLFSLGDILTLEGQLSAARDKYNESLALRAQIGEKGTTAETQMALALLLIEEGHASDAEEPLRNARAEFHQEGLGDDEILADIALARALLSQRRIDDAQNEVSSVPDLLSRSQDFSVSLRASIVQAQLEAAAGKPQPAIHLLQDTIASAEKFGYLGLQLEAQLALAQIEITASKLSTGQTLLADVKTRAQVRGFQLIANKAATALAAAQVAQTK